MAKNETVRLPTSSDRTVIVGRTGSGKSQAAIWMLSTQAIDRMPWVIIDYKNDELINSIEKAQVIDYSTVPKKPGVYILKVLPGEDEELEQWFWRVWAQENIGILVDEATMLGKFNRAFNACLTQGRSKRIPMIILTQQPVNISTYVFSEAGYWMVFDLTKKQNRVTVAENTTIPANYELPDYHSYYYDVSKKRLTTFSPVPDADAILERIDNKLPKTRRTL